MVSGMSELKVSRRRRAVAFMYFVFRLWKPTLAMKPFSVVGSIARIDSRLRPCAVH